MVWKEDFLDNDTIILWIQVNKSHTKPVHMAIQYQYVYNRKKV